MRPKTPIYRILCDLGFGPLRPEHQRLDGGVDIRSPFEDGRHLRRNRQLHAMRLPPWSADRSTTFAASWMMMDKIQRAILENQVILAEALWMLLHSQGISSDATLQNVSARIKATRKLLEEHSEENP